MMSNYFSRLDEIDKWLFDSFGILPGCGCSQENLRHTTARMVAEVLWPKKNFALTWEDMVEIRRIMFQINKRISTFGLKIPSNEEYGKEVLNRFLESKKEEK